MLCVKFIANFFFQRSASCVSFPTPFYYAAAAIIVANEGTPTNGLRRRLPGQPPRAVTEIPRDTNHHGRSVCSVDIVAIIIFEVKHHALSLT